uniref:LisH domain-containing protein n=1 Tax=Denticeps clupeoides TaxID=299321 RepID=A0AAY4B3S6_9TELE
MSSTEHDVIEHQLLYLIFQHLNGKGFQKAANVLKKHVLQNEAPAETPSLDEIYRSWVGFSQSIKKIKQEIVDADFLKKSPKSDPDHTEDELDKIKTTLDHGVIDSGQQAKETTDETPSVKSESEKKPTPGEKTEGVEATSQGTSKPVDEPEESESESAESPGTDTKTSTPKKNRATLAASNTATTSESDSEGETNAQDSSAMPKVALPTSSSAAGVTGDKTKELPENGTAGRKAEAETSGSESSDSTEAEEAEKRRSTKKPKPSAQGETGSSGSERQAQMVTDVFQAPATEDPVAISKARDSDSYSSDSECEKEPPQSQSASGTPMTTSAPAVVQAKLTESPEESDSESEIEEKATSMHPAISAAATPASNTSESSEESDSRYNVPMPKKGLGQKSALTPKKTPVDTAASGNGASSAKGPVETPHPVVENSSDSESEEEPTAHTPTHTESKQKALVTEKTGKGGEESESDDDEENDELVTPPTATETAVTHGSNAADSDTGSNADDRSNEGATNLEMKTTSESHTDAALVKCSETANETAFEVQRKHKKKNLAASKSSAARLQVERDSEEEESQSLLAPSCSELASPLKKRKHKRKKSISAHLKQESPPGATPTGAELQELISEAHEASGDTEKEESGTFNRRAQESVSGNAEDDPALGRTSSPEPPIEDPKPKHKKKRKNNTPNESMKKRKMCDSDQTAALPAEGVPELDPSLHCKKSKKQTLVFKEEAGEENVKNTTACVVSTTLSLSATCLKKKKKKAKKANVENSKADSTTEKYTSVPAIKSSQSEPVRATKRPHTVYVTEPCDMERSSKKKKVSDYETDPNVIDEDKTAGFKKKNKKRKKKKAQLTAEENGKATIYPKLVKKDQPVPSVPAAGTEKPLSSSGPELDETDKSQRKRKKKKVADKDADLKTTKMDLDFTKMNNETKKKTAEGKVKRKEQSSEPETTPPPAELNSELGDIQVKQKNKMKKIKNSKKGHLMNWKRWKCHMGR